MQHPRAGQGAGLRQERERAMEATALVQQVQQVERQLFIFEFNFASLVRLCCRRLTGQSGAILAHRFMEPVEMLEPSARRRGRSEYEYVRGCHSAKRSSPAGSLNRLKSI